MKISSLDQLARMMKGEFQKRRQELFELNQNLVKVGTRISQIESKLELVEKSFSIGWREKKQERTCTLLRLNQGN